MNNLNVLIETLTMTAQNEEQELNKHDAATSLAKLGTEKSYQALLEIGQSPLDGMTTIYVAEALCTIWSNSSCFSKECFDEFPQTTQDAILDEIEIFYPEWIDQYNLPDRIPYFEKTLKATTEDFRKRLGSAHALGRFSYDKRAWIALINYCSDPDSEELTIWTTRSLLNFKEEWVTSEVFFSLHPSSQKYLLREACTAGSPVYKKISSFT